MYSNRIGSSSIAIIKLIWKILLEKGQIYKDNHFIVNKHLAPIYKNTTVGHGGKDMHMEMVKRTTSILGSEGDRWQQRVV